MFARRLITGSNPLRQLQPQRFLRTPGLLRAAQTQNESKASKKGEKGEKGEKSIPSSSAGKREEKGGKSGSGQFLKEPAMGVNPAYDHAINWFNSQRVERQAKLETAKKERQDLITEIEKVKKDYQQAPSESGKQRLAELEGLTSAKNEEIKLHQIWLWRTDPQREKNARLGLENVPFPVISNLSNEEWKAYKADSRLRNMAKYWGIFDDVLIGNPFSPSVNLLVNYNDVFVHRGHELLPDLTKQKPTVKFEAKNPNTFHTLLMVDADEPNLQKKKLDESVHWLVTNIPGRPGSEITQGKTILDYIPPHPSNGSLFHRYVFILFEQSNRDLILKNPPSINDRFRSTKEFIESQSLTPIGYSFFRAQWNETVSLIYKDILKTKEPVWVDPSKTHKKAK